MNIVQTGETYDQAQEFIQHKNIRRLFIGDEKPQPTYQRTIAEQQALTEALAFIANKQIRPILLTTSNVTSTPLSTSIRQTSDVTNSLTTPTFHSPHTTNNIISEKGSNGEKAQSKFKHLLIKIADIVQYPIFGLGAFGAAYSLNIGQWLVVGFIIYSLIRRSSSKQSFAVALFLLLCIPLFQILKHDSISNNFAVYVYELLVFATAQTIYESVKNKDEGRQHFEYEIK